jgi:hypothetical protein
MALTLLEYQSDGGYLGIELDCVEKEGLEESAEATEHAVERGVNITDHVRRNAGTISLEGVVTNSPVIVPTTQMGGVTGSVQNTTLTVGGRQLKASVLAFSGSFDRARLVDEVLQSLMGTAVVRYTSTLRGTIEDLVITRYRVGREASTGNDLPFQIDLQRVRYATTQRVAVSPAQRRGRTRQNRGAQAASSTPAATDNRSATARIIDGAASRQGILSRLASLGGITR